MQLALIDWFILVSFFAITILIGLSYTQKAGKDISGFFLGGRNLPWYIAGLSMVATTFAADTPLAVTELVATNGIAGNWLWWNFLFGGMLTTFFFAKYWRRANILTEVEFIEIRYNGKPAAFLRGFKAVYLGVIMNVLIIGWVNLALVSILQVFFDIPKSEALLYTAGAMVFVAIYSSVSGLLGVAITDAIQFAVAMLGCIVLAVIVVSSEKIGGITGLKEKLPESAMKFFPDISGGDTIFSKGGISQLSVSIGAFFAYVGVQWWASWYPGAEPGGGGYVAQRMMSCRDEKGSLFATLFFQIAHYCIRPWPWIIVGLCAIILYPDLSEADKKLGYVYAMKDFLPAGFKGLMLAAFFAAYMSTISTQLNWGASYVVNDLYFRFINPNAGEKKLVTASRIATILLMILGLAVTTQITTISGVWSFIIECGAGLGLVLILRWYWWRINAWSEIAATVAPFIAYAFSRFYLQWEFPDSFFLTVAFTTVTWLVATFLTKPTEPEKLKAFYQKIQPDGVWNFEKNNNRQPSIISYLLICWLSAVVMTYCILFFIGELIFLEWKMAIVYGSSALVSFLILRYFIGKTGI